MKLDKEALTSQVLAYIDKHDTNYGIMIKGDWGLGKSYYVEHDLIPKINGYEPLSKNDSNETKSNNEGRNYCLSNLFKKGKKTTKKGTYKAIIISLFGIKNVNEIPERIIESQIEQYPILKHIKGVASKSIDIVENILSEKTQTQIALSDLLSNSDKYVYIFDDIERISESCNIEELFSYINNFVGIQHKKVVLICNEKKVLSRNNYKEFKEKIIRYTYELDFSINDVFDKMCPKGRDNENYTNDLIRHKKTVIDIFNASNHKNLRTLEYIIDLYEKIWEKKPIGKNNFEEEFLKYTLTTITILSIEYKLGIDSFNEIHQLTIDPIDIIDWDELNSNNTEDEIDEEDDQDVDTIKEREKLRKNVERKYKQFKEYIIPDEVYNIYVRSGYLDTNKFEESKNKLVQKLHCLQETEGGKTYKKLMNYLHLEDVEINRLVSSVKDYLDASKFSYHQVIDIIHVFSILKTIGFDIEMTQNDIEKWIIGSASQIDADELSSFAFNLSFHVDTPELTNAVNCIHSIVREKTQKTRQTDIESFKSAVYSNNSDFIKEKVSGDCHIYVKLGARDFYDFITRKDVTNSTLIALYVYLQDYKKHGNDKQLLIDLSNILDDREKTDLKIREFIIEKIQGLSDHF